jgi:hypothetical protein
MPLILCQPRAPGRKVYDTASRLSCIPGFRRVVRADERMPRISGVVKSEGDYEFQMQGGSQEPNQRQHSHRPVRGWVQCPPSKRRALAA